MIDPTKLLKRLHVCTCSDQGGEFLWLKMATPQKVESGHKHQPNQNCMFGRPLPTSARHIAGTRAKLSWHWALLHGLSGAPRREITPVKYNDPLQAVLFGQCFA